MKEHPILFSTLMVQAILKGSKTQTRRVIKDIQEWHPLPDITCLKFKGVNCGSILSADGEGFAQKYVKTLCPYGQPGDRLWVRETFIDLTKTPVCGAGSEKYQGLKVWYKADNTRETEVSGNYKPSIHMPRWASRINLEITNIRVQRVQEITLGDAIAEGVASLDPNWHTAALVDFQRLLDTINSKRGYSWEVNPWVWAITFKLLTPQLTS